MHVAAYYHPWMWALIHLFRYYCYFTTFFAITANWLPSDQRLLCYPRLRALYLDLIVVWCGFGWNLRKKMPSADLLEADEPNRDFVPDHCGED